MKKLLTLVLGSTALMGVSMIGAAQAEPDYPFAATGFFGGGGSWLSSGNQFELDDDDGDDSDVAHLEGGGDIVIPVSGYWNVQLGGAFHTDHLHFMYGGANSRTQFQGSAIGFWRDPASGVLGLEFGFFSPFGNEGGGYQNSFKIGGVAEYFFSDMLTFGAFGGALIPMEDNPFGNQKGGGKSLDTGFYAGGDLTYYASDTLALVGYARYTELNESFDRRDASTSQRSFNVGGKVRYLTSMPGVEIYASGSYLNCEVERSSRGRGRTYGIDGAQFMGGVEIHLGGHTDSLVAIDRSNTIDTRAWICGENGRASAASDRRLKTDIANLGETANGIKLYSWKYLSDPVNTWVGVMAQDLETSHPEALVTGTDGYYRVNYSALGVQMMTLDQWNSRKL
jgi:hypothetical protein